MQALDHKSNSLPLGYKPDKYYLLFMICSIVLILCRNALQSKNHLFSGASPKGKKLVVEDEDYNPKRRPVRSKKSTDYVYFSNSEGEDERDDVVDITDLIGNLDNDDEVYDSDHYQPRRKSRGKVKSTKGMGVFIANVL